VPYGQLLEQLRDAQWTGRRRSLRILPLLVFAARRRLIRAAGLLRRHAGRTPAAEDRGSGDMLMLGCFERVLFPAVSRAAVATIPGLRVPADQGCCGALHAHNGDTARGAELAERLARQVAGNGGRIVSTAGGCSAHLASVIGREKVVDYSEALLEQGVPAGSVRIDGRPARIGLQDSCHLRNGLGTTRQPREVIAALGEYVEVPGAGDCCGAAGTYSLLRPDESRRILADKIGELAKLDLDLLVVVNPGCQRQLIGALRRARLRTRVVHLAELVAMARADTDAETEALRR
jgi:glycolate oxidase iron-sulfur subunit